MILKWIYRCFFLMLLLGTSMQGRADTCNGFTNNLVSNCGFESGSFSGWEGTATTAGSNYAGVDLDNPYAGRYEAYLASVGSTITLSQTLTTTSNTGLYLVEFELLNDTSPSPGYTNSFAVLFGGNTYFTRSALVAGSYNLYTFVAPSSTSTTQLSFVSRNDGGTFDLDSVSVTATTPEPSTLLMCGTGVLSAIAGLRRKYGTV